MPPWPKGGAMLQRLLQLSEQRNLNESGLTRMDIHSIKYGSPGYPKDILTCAEIFQVQLFVLKSWKIHDIQITTSVDMGLLGYPKSKNWRFFFFWVNHEISSRYFFLKNHPTEIPGIYIDIYKLQTLSKGSLSGFRFLLNRNYLSGGR